MQPPVQQSEPRRRTFVRLVLATAGLAGCQREATTPPRPVAVRVATVVLTDDAPTVTLTGEIKPRLQSDLSFRVSGRVTERTVEVGAHVSAGQVLARIDPREQQASLDAAQAAVDAAEAQLRQASAQFERQKTLLSRGFSTRRDYDQAEEALRTAQGSLDSAGAQLGVARDQLSYTALQAGMPGIITARHAEAGEVVQAAQPIFTIARDGARDAVFNVHESILVRDPPNRTVEISLLSDPRVSVVGTVREVAPTLSRTTGTVTVKVGLDAPPSAMTLGAPVKGVGRLQARSAIVLPWAALSSQSGQPAVWIVDPHSQAVALQLVTIARYDSGQVVIRDGLMPGQLVVTSGAQLLRPGQLVALAPGAGQ